MSHLDVGGGGLGAKCMVGVTGPWRLHRTRRLLFTMNAVNAMLEFIFALCFPFIGDSGVVEDSLKRKKEKVTVDIMCPLALVLCYFFSVLITISSSL